MHTLFLSDLISYDRHPTSRSYTSTLFGSHPGLDHSLFETWIAGGDDGGKRTMYSTYIVFYANTSVQSSLSGRNWQTSSYLHSAYQYLCKFSYISDFYGYVLHTDSPWRLPTTAMPCDTILRNTSIIKIRLTIGDLFEVDNYVPLVVHACLHYTLGPWPWRGKENPVGAG